MKNMSKVATQNPLKFQNKTSNFGQEKMDEIFDEKKCLTKKERKEIRRKLKEQKRMEREKMKKNRREKKERKNKKRKKNKEKIDNNIKDYSSLIGPLEHENWEGYAPDLLWETDVAPGQSGLTEYDMDLGPTLSNETDPPKWLELTVGIDYTVIDFHGDDQVEKYVFTLFNIVSAIYEDPSLHSNLTIVLLRLIFYKDKSQSQVHEGSAKQSLESVNRWAETLFRLSSPHMKHDLAVWLTRLSLGGPSGYAPVAGVCDPARSCTLNREEGLTSAFIIAHEMGHVLGMSHDGDSSADNTCESEGRMGSVMAPLVAATFGRFHWSRCSKKEYFVAKSSWECLKNEPIWDKAKVITSNIKFQYTLDDQCRMEFGQGFGLCRAYDLSDPCTFLWCSNSSTPYLCKTKKGPPLEGTKCGNNKWCSNGFCELISISNPESEDKKIDQQPPFRHNPQHGGWSGWSEWGTCSLTCGTGVMFRSRDCSNPTPKWGGRYCEGKREEWKLCSLSLCPVPVDLRAQQCSILGHLVKLGKSQSKKTWLPHESKRKKKKCKLSCSSAVSNEIYIGKENFLDGTSCSYDDPHSICVQGKCVPVGCNYVIGSLTKFDECGVCGGNGSSCKKNVFQIKMNSDADYREVAVIPKGAWKVSVRESPSVSFLSLRDNSSNLVINANGRQEPERDFVSEGAMFHYIRNEQRESFYALGPLLQSVTVMMHGDGSDEDDIVTISYMIQESLENIFQWEVGSPSTCSVSCGGGYRRETVHCTDLRLQKKTDESYCKDLLKPSLKYYPCNTFGCEVRWIAGEWEHCTATCGSLGTQIRLVSCVRDKPSWSKPHNYIFDHRSTVRGYMVNKTEDSIPVVKYPFSQELFHRSEKTNTTKIHNNNNNTNRKTHKVLIKTNTDLDFIDPIFCNENEKPIEERTCNRFQCQDNWVPSGWSQCSATCGIGQQEVIFICSNKNFLDEINNSTCSQHPPREIRACFAGECPLLQKKESPCEKDQSTFCRLTSLKRYCNIPKYYQMCCKTCSPTIDYL